MDANEVLHLLGTGLVIVGILPATLFPILYARWFPFWKSTLGRALMTKAVGMALLVDISVLYLIFGDDYFLRELVRLVVFTLVVGGMYWQLAAIIGIRRADKAVYEQGRLDDSQYEQRPHEGEHTL